MYKRSDNGFEYCIFVLQCNEYLRVKKKDILLCDGNFRQRNMPDHAAMVEEYWPDGILALTYKLRGITYYFDILSTVVLVFDRATVGCIIARLNVE